MPPRSCAIETACFADLVADSERAFSSDSQYATKMASHAMTIQNKREIWALRLELRGEEARAQKLCGMAGVVFCVNSSPCGTGECPFARGDLKLLHLDVGKPRSVRPALAEYPDYNLEDAVRPLQLMRQAQPTAA